MIIYIVGLAALICFFVLLVMGAVLVVVCYSRRMSNFLACHGKLEVTVVGRCDEKSVCVCVCVRATEGHRFCLRLIDSFFL